VPEVPVHETGAVDHRIKTFEEEARGAFAALTSRGFQVESSELGTPDRRPFTKTVRFTRGLDWVATSLTLGFMGEDAVSTVVELNGTHRELPPAVAHKGHEMRNALAVQSRETIALVQ
jgi:hypothetical protein